MKGIIVGDIHFHYVSPSSRIDDYPRTVIRKMNYIIEYAIKHGYENILLTGDIFHSTQQPIPYLNEVTSCLRIARDNGIEVMSIIGNHDVPHGRVDLTERTPTGNLIESGCITWLKRKKIGNYTVYGVDYGQEIDEAQEDNSICIAHVFFNQMMDKDNLTSDVASRLGHSIYFLGHDHIPYDPVYLDRCAVYRPGSLTRGTSHTHQLNRKIYANTIDFTTGEVGCIEVPHQPSDEVFTEEAIQKFSVYGKKEVKDFKSELALLMKQLHTLE